MEYLHIANDKVVAFYNTHTRITQIAIGLTSIYIANKLYKKWKYSQKLFIKKQDIENKVVLMTGCDTGFGNAIALKLSIKEGYKVIATCLTQDAVDKFLSNTQYTKNKSTSIVLDVTNEENIELVKQFTIKYLKDTNSIFWGLVNNAGFSFFCPFELTPKEYDKLERDVLFNAPINIIRSFLPLIHGRKNYKMKQLRNNNNAGGRIVNMSSMSARFHWLVEPRYGPSKAALSYFSHCLRMEISSRFGIWVVPIEPAMYNTGILSASAIWLDKVKKNLIENNKQELMDLYNYKPDSIKEKLSQILPMAVDNIEPVVDCVIHGLTAKYPLNCYNPGWNLLTSLIVYGPWAWYMAESFSRRMQKELEK